MAKITVRGIEVTVMQINNEDYICITDMIKAKDGEFFVTDWLRNRNTLEYIGIWEQVHNKAFNYGEFAIIKSKAGLNSFKISAKELTEKTNAIGMVRTVAQRRRGMSSSTTLRCRRSGCTDRTWTKIFLSPG